MGGARPGSGRAAWRPHIRSVGRAVHVDHRRNAGRVRGTVCFNCNSATGMLGGSTPFTLRRAVAHLEGNAWKPTLVAPGVYPLPS
ncbi:endonuclease domain-containing protein [Streptomyces sp. NPDC005805]|uniref:endonuclease domain-containing protein n=1 Tax=Streptomyces sp. NPDC005805 TaxID=3157068 RepID=UPI0033DA69E3